MEANYESDEATELGDEINEDTNDLKVLLADHYSKSRKTEEEHWVDNQFYNSLSKKTRTTYGRIFAQVEKFYNSFKGNHIYRQ